jgi:hypothetical protein
MISPELAERLCGGWTPNDARVFGAMKALNDLGAKLYLSQPCHTIEVTENLSFTTGAKIGSAFQINFKNGVIWRTGQSYPKVVINWKAQVGLEAEIFDGDPSGLLAAISYLFNQ